MHGPKIKAITSFERGEHIEYKYILKKGTELNISQKLPWMIFIRLQRLMLTSDHQNNFLIGLLDPSPRPKEKKQAKKGN